jgi:hypothetical protein
MLLRVHGVRAFAVPIGATGAIFEGFLGGLMCFMAVAVRIIAPVRALIIKVVVVSYSVAASRAASLS